MLHTPDLDRLASSSMFCGLAHDTTSTGLLNCLSERHGPACGPFALPYHVRKLGLGRGLVTAIFSLLGWPHWPTSMSAQRIRGPEKACGQLALPSDCCYRSAARQAL